MGTFDTIMGLVHGKCVYATGMLTWRGENGECTLSRARMNEDWMYADKRGSHTMSTENAQAMIRTVPVLHHVDFDLEQQGELADSVSVAVGATPQTLEEARAWNKAHPIPMPRREPSYPEGHDTFKHDDFTAWSTLCKGMGYDLSPSDLATILVLHKLVINRAKPNSNDFAHALLEAFNVHP